MKATVRIPYGTFGYIEVELDGTNTATAENLIVDGKRLIDNHMKQKSNGEMGKQVYTPKQQQGGSSAIPKTYSVPSPQETQNGYGNNTQYNNQTQTQPANNNGGWVDGGNGGFPPRVEKDPNQKAMNRRGQPCSTIDGVHLTNGEVKAFHSMNLKYWEHKYEVIGSSATTEQPWNSGI